jgi:putative oxidoreductase
MYEALDSFLNEDSWDSGHWADKDRFFCALELFCGLLLLAGVFIRPVAFVVSGEMAVAYFTQHAPHGFWPIVNMGELALVYCVVFLYLAVVGGGPFCLERLWRPGR